MGPGHKVWAIETLKELGGCGLTGLYPLSIAHFRARTWNWAQQETAITSIKMLVVPTALISPDDLAGSWAVTPFLYQGWGQAHTQAKTLSLVILLVTVVGSGRAGDLSWDSGTFSENTATKTSSLLG